MGNAAQRKKILRLADFLRKRFDIPKHPGKTNLLDCLIQTILSQSTTDHNRDLAFHCLKREFSNWDSVANAKKAADISATRVTQQSSSLAHQPIFGNQRRRCRYLVWLGAWRCRIKKNIPLRPAFFENGWEKGSSGTDPGPTRKGECRVRLRCFQRVDWIRSSLTRFVPPMVIQT